ncbi:MAG: hypothetical protein J1E37_04460 [Prevotella sp.]|nr:hypothetical protein [Prevotella sp.]
MLNRYLSHILLIALLWCGLADLSDGVTRLNVFFPKHQQAQHDLPYMPNGKGQELSYDDGWLPNVAEEPQGQINVIVRSGGSSHRVGSSRPTRLLPTYGGKPGSHYGRWAKDFSSHFVSYSFQHSYWNRVWLRMGASFPRHYFVIALRRLLC